MLIGHRQASFRFGSLNLLATALLTMPAMSLAAQTLEIKLVDGRNGRPMVETSAYVNVQVGGARKEAIAIPTDESGVARLQLTLNPNEVNVPNSTGHGTIVANYPVVQYDESFRINVPYVVCGSGEGDHSPLGLKNFSTKEVLDHGYASGNTCGKVTATPQPGQVVLFVRRPTFMEKMKQQARSIGTSAGRFFGGGLVVSVPSIGSRADLEKTHAASHRVEVDTSPQNGSCTATLGCCVGTC